MHNLVSPSVLQVTMTNTLDLAGAAPVTGTAQITVAVVCGAAVTADITVKGVTINRFTWSLSKASSPSSITLTRNERGSVGYTVTAAQRRDQSTNSIAGVVRVTNTGTSIATINAATVKASDGSTGPATCSPPAVSPAATSTCAYNITYGAAPAAGTVSATITFADGSSITTPQPAQIDWTTATTFDVGKCVYVTDTFSSGGTSGGALLNGFSFEPPDGKPPSDGNLGLEICESRTFSYTLQMQLTLCTDRVVS